MIKNSRNIWLAISGIAVIIAAIAGNHDVPLYDGVGFPDEPYRYVQSTNASNKQPTPEVQSVTTKDLLDGYSIKSNEVGPQVKLVFGPAGVTLPSGASSVKISMVPSAPKSQPSDGKIVGNVYTINGVSDAGDVLLKPNYVYVYLRLPQKVSYSTQPDIIFRGPTDKGWKILPTNQTGNDIFEAALNNWGDYAMSVGSKSGAATASGKSYKSSTNQRLLTALIVTVLIVGGILVVIRLASKRNHGSIKK